MGRFNFTGIMHLNKLDKPNPYIRTGKTKNGIEYKTFSTGIASAVNNRAYVELFGMDNDVIKTMDKDNNAIEVSKADRFDDDVVEMIANYRKYTVEFDERKDFISAFDAVSYLEQNAIHYDGKPVRITGQVAKNVYNGTVRDRFQIQSVHLASEEDKKKLQIVSDVYWTTDDVDVTDWKTEKKIYINGYTREYIDKDTGNKFLPQQCVFDASKIDFNNEHHVQVLDYKLRNLGFVREQGKIKCTLKKNTVYTLRMIFTYVNGAEEVAFDESSLTPNQKEAIALGLKTIDDFRPRGSIYGNRITQYKISDFDLRDDAADGAYDCGITVSEFDDDKFTIVKEETVETVLEAAMNAPETEDDEDLFA